MATYKIDVVLDESQDRVLKRVAVSQTKTALEVVQSLSPVIVAQIDQWIQDRITTKLGQLDKADILARLEYFDNR